MFRKVASLAVAIVVAGGVMIAVPADAAVKISNGVACKKSGAKAKGDLGSYKCTKNPLSTSKKLTWLNLDCITASNVAVKAQKDSIKTIKDFNDQVLLIDVTIAEQKVALELLQEKLDKTDLRIPLAEAKLAAAKTTADKTELAKAVKAWTAASRAYTSQVRQIEAALKRLETTKVTTLKRPNDLSTTIKESLATAKLICAKGF